MGVPIPDTGSVTEDTDVVGGLLTTSGDINYFLGDDTGDWTVVSNDTSLGFGSSFSMDEDGNWDFFVDNDDPDIQALNSGESLDFEYAVSSVNGNSTVTITVFGVDEPPCFVRGTLIDTPAGPRPIEDLCAGDEVLTTDYGPTRISWIGSKRTGDGESALRRALAPITILPDALGPGVPSRPLTVSPLHRVLWRGPQAQLLFGEREVLCAAQTLVNDITVVQAQAIQVEYFHIMLEEHSLILAEGCESESLFPGREGLYRFGETAQEEIFELFPDLRSCPASYGQAARRILKSYECKALMAA
ncbi:MAG: Hint domain-containing protein [Tateyamaria sp.]|jgi:VCBS repeat-containing protein|uniref:Hint domain-containing protein n=1 Tax=Tateyamaria sp. TaxID=1929288 RepID=UPI0032DC6772